MTLMALVACGGSRGLRGLAEYDETAASERVDALARGGTLTQTEARTCFRRGAQGDTDCVSFHRAACEREIWSACVLVGLSEYDQGQSAQAGRWFRRACRGGAPMACNIEGMRVNETSGAGEAAPFFREACADDYAPGCTNLARAVFDGVLLRNDEQTALEIAERACALGDSAGCAVAGSVMLSEPEPDHAHAARRFGESCEGGFALGCVALAQLLAAGAPHLEVDAARARALLGSACELGSAQGCAQLAEFASSGTGGPVDRARAREARTRACALGQRTACND